MAKTVMLAVASGLASALLAGLHGVPSGIFLAFLAPLPLLIVGLGSGSGAAAVAVGCGLVLFTLFGGGVFAAGVYGGTHGIPSWLMVQQSLQRRAAPDGGVEWSSPGSVLSVLAIFGALVACGAASFWAPGIEGNVREALNGMVGALAEANIETPLPRIADILVPLLFGTAGVMWVMVLVVNGVIAQGLLARGGNNLRPTPRWSSLTLPNWLSWVLVGTAALALVSDGDIGYLARNAVVILAAPYFFLGLAVVHDLCRRLSIPGLVLVVFYVSLIWLLMLVGPIVAGLGVLEQWAGVRRRFGAPDQESE